MDLRMFLFSGLVGCGGAPFTGTTAPAELLASDSGSAVADSVTGQDAAVFSPETSTAEAASPARDAAPDTTPSTTEASPSPEASQPACAQRGQPLPTGTVISASKNDFGTTPYGIVNGGSWTPGATSSWLMLMFPSAQTLRGLALILDSNGPDPQIETISYVADSTTVAVGTATLNGSVSGGPAMFGGVTIDKAPTGPAHTLEITFSGSYNINVLSVTLLTEACP